MKIAFNSLAPVLEYQRPEIDAAIKRVLDSGIFINGPEVKAFEESFAKRLNCDYGIGCANGTDAITLSLLALSHFADHNQNEVITVANSAPATVAAICNAGLSPVFVDVLPNGLMDLEKACLLFNNRTLALLPVHLYGQVLDLSGIRGMAQDAGIFIVEDGAQAFGSKGFEANYSTVKCVSFYPTKNLGALGDGGGIATNWVHLANYIYQLKNYGLNKQKCIAISNGYNSRLDEMQAAILSAKLKTFDFLQDTRRSLAEMYFGLLPVEVLHRTLSDNENFHLFTIRSKRRDELHNYLASEGVDTMVHYPVPACDYSTMEFWNPEHHRDDLPETYKHCEEVLSLPLYPGLKIEEVMHVCDLISKFYNE